ncbi:MAG: hypothetical protein IKK47_02835 [Ruminococcus sp.]|nr:hypothetical protein [Ruminococcus sp.]
MKIKRILSFLTVLCLGISMCGCGSKKSSSESDNTPKDSFELPEDIVYCDTEDGLFEFAVSSDTPDGVSSDLIDKTEFVFNLGDDDTLIGVMTVTDYHQTAAGMGTGLSSGFEESGLYSNIKGEELTINGNPAYRLTADCENDILYTLTTLQFGNGDIFVTMSTSTPENREKCDLETDIILHSAEYKGKPLKSEPETYSNIYFSITAGEKWYFRKQTKDFASISLNLQNDISDMMYAFSFSALTDESDIKTAAKNNAEKLMDEPEFLRDTSDYMGFKAEHIHYLNSLDAYVDYYIFENDGVIYQAIEVCPTNRTEQYKTDIQEIIDSIDLK